MLCNINSDVSVYYKLQKELAAGQFDLLAEVHATSTGLKAFTTWFTSDGIETCRKCCGGHGYLLSSGLPDMFARYVPACTYEGDNVVLLQQTARYLLKAIQTASAGQPVAQTVQYLSRVAASKNDKCPVKTMSDWLNGDVQLKAYTHRAGRLVAQGAMRIQVTAHVIGTLSKLCRENLQAAKTFLKHLMPV